MIPASKHRLKPYNLPEINDIDLAYIAGYFDGEGSFGFNRALGRDNKFRRITISMTHTHLPTLNWLQDTLQVGGIYWRDKNLTQNFSKKQQYQYMIFNQTAVYVILQALLPYLKEKQEKAMELIAYFEKKYGGLTPF